MVHRNEKCMAGVQPLLVLKTGFVLTAEDYPCRLADRGTGMGTWYLFRHREVKGTTRGSGKGTFKERDIGLVYCMSIVRGIGVGKDKVFKVFK